MNITIRPISYEQASPLWQNEEMSTNLKRVSSMMYWDGREYLGGNQFKVHDYTYSTPHFLGAFDGDLLVGTVSYHKVTKDQWRMRGLYVLHDYRRRSIGTALQQRMIVDLKENHKKASFVWVFGGEQSIKLHEKANFRRTSPYFAGTLPDGNYVEHKDCYMILYL